MSEYYSAYLSRVSHLGSTKQEIAKSMGELEFARNLESNKNTVRGLKKEDGTKFDGILLPLKQTPNRNTLHLLTALSESLEGGEIFFWVDEPWLILYRDQHAYEAHQRFVVVRCNYLLKWIDGGVIQSVWCHLVSSEDSKIKENFRTWHNLITPQANKFLEILIPARKIKKYTEFIVDDEKWYMVEKDSTSVKGVWYMSCTETKVNALTDDTDNAVANAHTISRYRIDAPTLYHPFASPIVPQYTVYKDGKPFLTNEGCTVKPLSGVDENLNLLSLAGGELQLTYTTPDGREFIATQRVEAGAESALRIEGADKIKVNRSARYAIVGTSSSLPFSLDNTDLAKIAEIKDNECVVQANNKNKLGVVTLRCGTTEKKISIIPLWGS